MSGHSKWSTIKRQKGAADQKRGAAFTKLANAITIAVRQGGGVADPDFNFKLRLAVEKAREANMPKENIQRSIDRGAGKGETVILTEAVYEGFAPHGVAVIVETISDNNTRTSNELRNIFNKQGANLAGQGAVSYMFTRTGEIEIDKAGQNLDSVFEKAMEAGATDIEENEDSFSVYTSIEELHKVKDSLAAGGLKILSAELVFRPNKDTLVTLSDDKKAAVEEFVGLVDELDDVQNIYYNLA